MIDLHEEHEFVDYYALLEVPVTTDEKELRKRIFDLYDEARHNLEHRSHRKRFYYVSLYETHLARARHFLLDADMRSRYDACLSAYQAGRPFDYRSLFEKPAGAKSTARQIAGVIHPVSSAPGPEPVAPAQITEVAKAAPAAPSPVAVAPATVTPPSATAPIAATAPVHSAVPAQHVPSEAERTESADRLEKLLRTPTLDPAQVGRRRDYQRRELIGGELKAQGRFSSLITFSISLLVGAILVWKLETSLSNPTDGTLTSTDVVLILLAIGLLCGAAYVASWYASRLTRRQIIAKLSRMSYDELLHHCRS